MSTKNGVAAGPAPACRRCGDCVGAEHHWIDDFELTEYGCKHCDAIGVACPDCNDGEIDIEDGSTYCPRCAGVGILEVVEITAAEVAVLRRDQARLRTADELWRTVCRGESLIAAVDQLQATVVSGLSGGRRVSVPATAPAGEWPDRPLAAGEADGDLGRAVLASMRRQLDDGA